MTRFVTGGGRYGHSTAAGVQGAIVSPGHHEPFGALVVGVDNPAALQTAGGARREHGCRHAITHFS